MIDSEPSVFSWLVLALEVEIRAASGMYEFLWGHFIIKSAPYVAQERYNESFTCNYVMWCNTSSVRIVWYFSYSYS